MTTFSATAVHRLHGRQGSRSQKGYFRLVINALQVSVFSVASPPSEFSQAVALAIARMNATCMTGESQECSTSLPSTVVLPLPSARMIPTRPNASDKFHSAPDNRYALLSSPLPPCLQACDAQLQGVFLFARPGYNMPMDCFQCSNICHARVCLSSCKWRVF